MWESFFSFNEAGDSNNPRYLTGRTINLFDSNLCSTDVTKDDMVFNVTLFGF